MIIKKTCNFCHKTTDLVSEIPLGDLRNLLIFACGHSYIEDSLLTPQTDPTKETQETQETLLEKLEKAIPEFCEVHQRKCIKVLESHTGKHLFPYQAKGIIAATKANARFIFADEMGLGKTIQGLGTILINQEKLLPGIFVCKSIAKINMLWEVMDWLQIPAQVISHSHETPWDMFKMHIISYDMINRLDKMFKFSDMKSQVECPECHYRCDEGKHEYCPECSRVKTSIGDVDREQTEHDGKIITVIKNTQVQERKKEIPKLIPWFDSSISPGSSLRDQNKQAWYG